MASSSYFFSDSTRRPSIERSEPPPATPSSFHSHRNHHESPSVSLSDAPFPGFQTPARDAGLRSVENSPFLSRSERSPSFGRSTEYGLRGGGGGAGSYGDGGTGGKLRSAKKQAKRTPYERPPTGRHATAGGSAALVGASSAGGSSGIASKIRDSASRFLTSSASYLFSSLFKSRPLALRSSGDSEKEQNEGNAEAAVRAPVDGINEQNGIALEEFDAIEPVSGKLDIVQVEEVLKQRTWSRDQVNRLTEILQSRLSESSYAKPKIDSYVSPNVKGFLEPPKETESSTPVQVARAYMEDQGARPVGIAASSSLHTPLPVQASAQRRVLEDRYASSPRTLARTSGTIRMLKRSFALEEELPSVGHARRVRQKTSVLPASPYLYSKHIGSSSAWTQKKTTSLIPKSSETALKILETLDKFSPSPKPKALAEKSPASRRLSPSAKGKSLDENMAIKSPDDQQIPETSKEGEQSWRRSPNKVTYSKSPEPSSNGEKLGLDSTNVEAPQYSVNEVQPGGKPRGFRMTAMFEESVSDEECKVDVETCKRTTEAATVKPSPTSTASGPSTSEVSLPVSNTLPFFVQSNNAKEKSESIALNASPPRQRKLPSPVENPPSEPLTPVSTETSSVRTLPVETVNVATSTSPSMTGTQGEQPHHAVVSFPSASASVSTLTCESLSKVSDFKVPVLSTSPPLFKPIFQAQPPVTTVSEPALSSKADIISAAPVTPTPEVTKVKRVADEISETQNGSMMATERPIPDKGSELDTMATDAMAEETAPSSIAAISSGAMAATPSTSTFSFGGSPMSSPSAFSFTSSSSLSTASSFSASIFAFGGQSSSSVGQVSVTSSGLLPNSISAPSSSSFVFGSSSSSTSGLFTSNTSGSSSLVASSTSPFQFGASAASSSSNLFSSSGASMSPAFGFVSSSSSPLIGSSATPFLFGGVTASAPQASSSATVAQPFTFGSAQSNPSTSSSTVVSTSSANPFAPSGTTGSIPFQFGSSTTASTSPSSTTFTFGSTNASSTTPASVFSFGASSTPAAASMVASSEATFSFASSSTFSFGSTGTTSSSSPSSGFGSSSASPFGSSNINASSSSNAFTFVSNPTPNTLPFGANPTPVTFGASPFGGGQPAGTPMFGGSTSQPTFGSSQPAAQPTFGSSQPAAQLTFGSSQPAVQPSFGSSQTAAQPTFGLAQPTFGAAQPAAPPMFGATQPTFGLAQPTAMTSFGQTQPATPSQFTFGGQQQQAPFTFGGQPGMPTQNPFSAGAGSQPGADFAGGFALGATGGGEKGGRKFIKAKRTGAAKRGGK